VGELAQLITAVAGLITALGGVLGVVITARRTSQRERPAAARNATDRLLKSLATAAKDGELTHDELLAIAESQKEERDSDD